MKPQIPQRAQDVNEVLRRTSKNNWPTSNSESSGARRYTNAK